jgi:hypothetical protein
MVIQGRANSPLWFRQVNGGYVGEFFVKETLVHDAGANVYRLFELDGSYTEFSDSTGVFRRQVDPAGNKIEVQSLQGYSPQVVERTYTSGGSTTTEQYFYEYGTTLGDPLLSRVTLRRKVGAGQWTNVSRASYTYYAENQPHGELGDLRTVATEVPDGSQWQATGTTLYRYYKQFSTSSSSSSSSSS